MGGAGQNRGRRHLDINQPMLDKAKIRCPEAGFTLGFEELRQLLKPWFGVHIFEHDYGKIAPWDGQSGNALFVCVKTTVPAE